MYIELQRGSRALALVVLNEFGVVTYATCLVQRRRNDGYYELTAIVP